MRRFIQSTTTGGAVPALQKASNGSVHRFVYRLRCGGIPRSASTVGRQQPAASSGIVPLPFHLVKDLHDSNRLTGEKLSLRGGYRLHLLIAVESQS